MAIVGACPRIEAKRVKPAGAAQLPEHGLRDVVAWRQRQGLPHQANRLPRPPGFGLGEAQEEVQVGVAGVARPHPTQPRHSLRLRRIVVVAPLGAKLCLQALDVLREQQDCSPCSAELSRFPIVGELASPGGRLGEPRLVHRPEVSFGRTG